MLFQLVGFALNSEVDDLYYLLTKEYVAERKAKAIDVLADKQPYVR